MTYDEFKNKITLGYCNAETHIGVTLFFTDKQNSENNFDFYFELPLPKQVKIHQFLDIDFDHLKQNCEHIFQKLFNEYSQKQNK